MNNRDFIFCMISAILAFTAETVAIKCGLTAPHFIRNEKQLLIYCTVTFIILFFVILAITTKTRNYLHLKKRRNERIDRAYYDFEKLRRK